MALIIIKYFHYINSTKFTYLIYRFIISLLTALFISFAFGSYVINFLNKNKIYQKIRSNTPKTHSVKKNTPTMGGLLILFSVTISVLFWSNLSNIYIWYTLTIFLGFGAIGVVDDFKKVYCKTSKGLSSGWKFFFICNYYYFHYFDLLQY